MRCDKIGNVYDEGLRKRHPLLHLRLLESNEIDVVALPTPFKQIVENSCSTLGDLTGLHEMLVEETAYTRMSR